MKWIFVCRSFVNGFHCRFFFSVVSVSVAGELLLCLTYIDRELRTANFIIYRWCVNWSFHTVFTWKCIEGIRSHITLMENEIAIHSCIIFVISYSKNPLIGRIHFHLSKESSIYLFHIQTFKLHHRFQSKAIAKKAESTKKKQNYYKKQKKWYTDTLFHIANVHRHRHCMVRCRLSLIVYRTMTPRAWNSNSNKISDHMGSFSTHTHIHTRLNFFLFFLFHFQRQTINSYDSIELTFIACVCLSFFLFFRFSLSSHKCFWLMMKYTHSSFLFIFHSTNRLLLI